MKKKDFLPIILGSDENAYGTARLFREAYPEVTPLLVCTTQLIPTRHSRLFDCRIIAGFEREEVFPDALLGVLRECSKDYEKLLVIPCSDYYTGLLCRHCDHFEGLIANRFIPEQLLETFDTKDRFYALCEQYGMDYPKTVIAAPDERIEVADRLPFDFPIVVKPENSNALDYLRCHFEGQKKVFFLRHQGGIPLNGAQHERLRLSRQAHPSGVYPRRGRRHACAQQLLRHGRNGARDVPRPAGARILRPQERRQLRRHPLARRHAALR